jgi:hypothetical protein
MRFGAEDSPCICGVFSGLGSPATFSPVLRRCDDVGRFDASDFFDRSNRLGGVGGDVLYW